MYRQRYRWNNTYFSIETIRFCENKKWLFSSKIIRYKLRRI